LGDGAPGVSSSSVREVITIQMNEYQVLDDLFNTKGPDIACVVLDLMPNRAGLIPADVKFISYLKECVSRNGALLILDEVMSFRLGLGGLHQVYNVIPDLITLGKIVGGGFPAGAVGGKNEIMNILSPGKKGILSWGGTFNANPISMSAGVATLDKYDATSIESLNYKGNLLRENLIEKGIRVNGYGSLLRVFPPRMEEAWWRFYSSGLLIGTNGLIALSTAMTEADIEKIFGTMLESREILINH